jgi:hypothetical protein
LASRLFLFSAWYEEQDIRKPKDECKVMLPVMSDEDDFTFDRLPIDRLCFASDGSVAIFRWRKGKLQGLLRAPLMMPYALSHAVSLLW